MLNLAYQSSCYVPPVHVNGAVKFDDSMAPGASVGHPLITPFHFIGLMHPIRRECPFEGNAMGPLRSGFCVDSDQSIDASYWLPTGCAQVLSDYFPVDYGRFVRRDL